MCSAALSTSSNSEWVIHVNDFEKPQEKGSYKRIERISKIVKQVFIRSACGMSLGAAAVMVAAVGGARAGAGGAAAAAVVAAAAAGARPGAMGTVIVSAAAVVTVVGAAEKLGPARAGELAIAWAIAGVIAGVIRAEEDGAARAAEVVAEAAVGAAAGAVGGVALAAGLAGSSLVAEAAGALLAGTAAAAVGAASALALAAGPVGVAALGAKVFKYLKIKRNDQITIGCGTFIGAAAALMMDGEMLTTLAITSLASGIFSGAATLMNRRIDKNKLTL